MVGYWKTTFQSSDGPGADGDGEKHLFSKRLKDDGDNIDVVLGTDGLKIRGGRSSIDLIEQLSEAPSDFQTSAFSTKSN